MKALVVELRDVYGHQVFDKIHYNAIASCGVDILLASKRGYFDYLKNDSKYKDSVSFNIPSFLYLKYKNRLITQIMTRVLDILKLLYIRWVAKKCNPDCIIFLEYDIMSFFTFRTTKPVILINHTNVDELTSNVKLFLTKHLPNQYIHVNLNENIEKRMKELLPHVVSVVIPHGFITIQNTLKIGSKLYSLYGGYCIFCPLSSSYDKKLLDDILTSSKVNDYLESNRIIILIKGSNYIVPRNNHIVKLPDYIDSDLYRDIMSNSKGIFLPYDESFRYRVSGILHECFSYNTPVVCSNTESFSQYRDYINYKFLVKDSNSFIEVLDSIKNSETYYVNLDELSPERGWRELLNSSQIQYR